MGRFVFLSTSMQARSFSPKSEFTGSSIKAKCEPVKKYKRAREKGAIEPVKSPYGVERYCDMTVSPTRSHLHLPLKLSFGSYIELLVKVLQFTLQLNSSYRRRKKTSTKPAVQSVFIKQFWN